MFKKKALIMGVVLVMVVSLLALAGCGGNNGNSNANTDDDKFVIGLSMEALVDFMAYVADGFQEYADENDDVDVIVVDANYDVATQLGQVENFISQGVDAIVIKAVDRDATQAMSDAAKAAGIPFLAVNIEVGSDRDAYVGSDHEYSGVLQAEYVAELLDGEGRVAILMGDPSHDAARERTDGNKDVFANFPGIEVVAEQSGYWQRDRGMEVAENWIQAGLEVDAVLGNNDAMVIGAMLAFEQAGVADGVVFAGIDAIEDALNLMNEGRMHVTVFQNGFAQGYGAAEAAHQILQGESVPSYVDIPYELIPPERADEILAEFY
ncbi:substrate-binding domain-containing protein [Dethiobacter alkaliphilus]|uniref:substrate-binding domain-containing protein n=1 Tax=Dethiobacter alkaliphilus TaxID=427926 RepID=UPI002227083F|nr:substrate-binding domain-containing protein [Dethiobacter alkaliphilus]MCW3489987.1 substrate-binding domain-containing protein [Dethiobacter alkaliphilus]